MGITANGITGIEGKIFASGWDDDGTVLSISIKTNSDEEFPIMLDDQGRKLLNQGQCYVRLNGEIILQDEDWRNKIKVKSFEILKRA